MGEAIKHCLGNLTNFDGRDPRRTFWFYMLFLAIIYIVISIITGVVFAASAVGSAFEAGAAGADPAAVEAQMMSDMSGSIMTSVYISIVVSLVFLFLFIASFVRRVRDGGFPPALAAIPVVTQLVGIYGNYSTSAQMQELMASGDMMGVAELGSGSILFSVISFLGFIFVIVMGVMPTKNASAG